MSNVKEAPCYYKKSCGYELCQGTACKEYVPKKQGSPYYGDEDEGGNEND